MAINISRLDEELRAAGLAIAGCGTVSDTYSPGQGSTVHTRIDGRVRVDWSMVPSPIQETTAEGIIQAHNGNKTFKEKLQDAFMREGAEVLAALVERASDNWQSLSAARKAQVMDIINSASDRLENAVGW